MKVRKADRNNFIVATDNTKEVIRLFNKAFAFTVHDARISKSSGTEIERTKFAGPVPTILRLITQREGDHPTYFDIDDETEAGLKKSS